jgi:hypothetical protein
VLIPRIPVRMEDYSVLQTTLCHIASQSPATPSYQE